VGGVGAWHLLRNQASPAAGKMFSMAMWMAICVAPLQIIAGDMHGINTLEYQPAKIAAMEGHFDSEKGSSLILFGVPDDEAEVTRYQVAIPYLGALILTHSLDGEVKGLKSFPRDQRPPSQIVFWSFRLMVALGFAMLATGLWGAWSRYRNTLYKDKWLHRVALAMLPSGFIAVLAGWVTTEVGRQPYTIYGLLTTAQSVAPISAPAVAASLLAFIVIYFAVFGAGVFYIYRLARSTPDHPNPDIAPMPMHASGITPGPTLEMAQGGTS
jgi:cytochrome bd ubiquinol oxidase subunit I